jgi:hypothetical protein
MDQPQPQAQAAVMKKELPAVGDLLRRTWAAFKAHWLLYVAIMVVPTFISFFSTTKAVPGAILWFFVMFFLQLWAQATLLYAVTHEGQKPDFSAAFRGGFPLVGPVLWVGFLVGLITAIGFLLLIIPGIIWGISYSLALVVCVVEGAKGMDALKRSKSYVKNYWAPVFLRFIAVGILSALVGMIFSMFIPNDPDGSYFTSIAGLITTPFTTIYAYLLYRDLKAVKGTA